MGAGREKINARGLAALLKLWGVRSRNGREHGTGDVGKGYYAEDMADAFSCYVRSTATDGESEQASPVADCVADESDPSATAADLPQPSEVAEVADVAAECLDGASRLPDVSPLRCSDPACDAGSMRSIPGSAGGTTTAAHRRRTASAPAPSV